MFHFYSIRTVRLFLFTFLFTLVCSIAVKSQCPTSGQSISSQEDLDDFINTYSNCPDIPFVLSINDTIGDISSLEGLEFIESFEAALLIENCSSLTSLDGLNNLGEVVYFRVNNNPVLNNIDADNPDVFGLQIIKGLKDNDGNEKGLSSFVSHSKGPSVNGQPMTPEEYYNYATGNWKDGSPITVGNTGFGGTEETPFMFTDLPNDPDGWSMVNEGILPYRHFTAGIGPVNLQPGESRTITFAILYDTYNDNDISNLIENANQLKEDYDSIFAIPCNGMIKWYADYDGDGLGDPNQVKYACEIPANHVSNADDTDDGFMLGVAGNSIENKLLLSPNPANEQLIIQLVDFPEMNFTIKIHNTLGQSIHQQSVKNKRQLKLDVSKYQTGIYFLEMNIGPNKIIKTFVVE